MRRARAVSKRPLRESGRECSTVDQQIVAGDEPGMREEQADGGPAHPEGLPNPASPGG